MRKFWTLLPIIFCVAACSQTQRESLTQAPTYIIHITIIDTDTGRETSDQTVIVSGHRIQDIRDSQRVSAPRNSKVVDGRGKYLIPGLWDMHVHGTEFESTLPLYIANGVTGVREMFGPPDANKFRAELAAKHLIAPHIYLGSPIIDGNPPIWPDSIAVATADEARKAVDEQKQKGADFIKVYSVLSREAYFAIVDEAKRQNIPVEGHVPNSLTIWEVIAAKQRSFEHSFGIEVACSSREKELRPKFLAAQRNRKEWEALRFEAWQSYSDERCKNLFVALKNSGTWPVPTLVVHYVFGRLDDPQFTSDNRLRYFWGEFREWMNGNLDPRMKDSASDFARMRGTFRAEQRVTGKLFRAGVPMLAGTDVGNVFCFPGFSLHDELALLVESGVTPLGALQMATRNPAQFMNATDKYGSVRPGKIADLVMLDADPLEDIHNTTKISEVFLDGKEYDRAALDQILAAAEKNANARQRLSMPGPDVQNLMLGTWDINVKYPPASGESHADTGKGTEIWRSGPGGRSVIEEYREKNTHGEVQGLAIAWWDKKAQGQRFVWCDNSIPDGCYVSKEVAKWDGNNLLWREEQNLAGGSRVYAETFKDITVDSFTQILQEGKPGQPLQNTATISALRKSEPATITEQSVDDSGSKAEVELRAFMAELRKGSIEGDVDTIANSITDDYIQTDINGYRQNKTTWLSEYFKPLADLIKAGKFHWDEYERTNLQFQFYEHCAIVTGELHAKGTGAKFGAQHTWVADPNASFSGTLDFTHVYIKQNGKWMLAALHNQIPLPTANSTPTLK